MRRENNMELIYVSIGKLINVEAIQSVDVMTSGRATVYLEGGRRIDLNSLEWHNLKAYLGITGIGPVDRQ